LIEYQTVKIRRLSFCNNKDAVSGYDDAGHAPQIGLYPNPASHKISIDYSGIEALHVELYSMFGLCVIQCKLSSKSDEIDVSQLSKGIYIVKIIAAGRTMQEKLINE